MKLKADCTRSAKNMESKINWDNADNNDTTIRFLEALVPENGNVGLRKRSAGFDVLVVL